MTRWRNILTAPLDNEDIAISRWDGAVLKYAGIGMRLWNGKFVWIYALDERQQPTHWHPLAVEPKP